ncbi:MAG: hypothetical protein NT070_18730 [Cyanobacteria bacterium]|nr:hypothetical protein [Cyanobacteriota bacterium]
MFNTLFRKNFTESAYIPEPTYIEVSGLMDDFISLEEIAPGAEWSDVLAATWGTPSAPDTVEMRSAIISKSPIARAIRSFFQSFRSSLEVA